MELSRIPYMSFNEVTPEHNENEILTLLSMYALVILVRVACIPHLDVVNPPL